MSLLPPNVFFRSALNCSLRSTRIPRTTFVKSTRGFRTTVANMGVHNIENKAAFQKALDDSTNKETGGYIVVLDAFATWCGPCKVIAPTIAQWSESEFKHVRFYKLDVDEVSDVAQELGIRAMPTFIIFKDGKPVKEVVGANPKALKTWIEEFAGKPEDEKKAE